MNRPGNSLMCYQIFQVRFSRGTLLLLASALAGCSSVGSGETARLRADTPLVKVDVMALPVLMRSSATPRDKGLLDPNAQPAVLTDSEITRRNCSRSAVDRLPEVISLTPEDRSVLERVLALGPQLQQERYAWSFETQRAQAQERLLSGQRSTREGSPTRQVQPRPTSGATQQSQPPRNSPLIPMLRVPIVKPNAPGRDTPGLAEARQQLAHNLAVLGLQQSNLDQREAAYATALLQVLDGVSARWKKLNPSSLTLRQVDFFETFRLSHIAYCAEIRGASSAEFRAQVDQVGRNLKDTAQRAVADKRPELKKTVEAFTTSIDLEFWLGNEFATGLVQSAITKDELIGISIVQSKAVLQEKELRLREAALREATAETARRSAVRRSELLANARRNAAPSADQIAVLLTERSATLTDGETRYRIKRTGDFSYQTLLNFLGTPFVTNSVLIQVTSLTCKVEAARQRCNFVASYDHTPYSPWSGAGEVERTTDQVSALFFWTEAGLHVEGELHALYVGLVASNATGGSTSTGASSTRGSSLADTFMQRDQENRQRFNDYNQANQYRQQYNPGKQY